MYLAASTNLKTPELSVMWSLKYQLKHLAKSQAMSARLMTTRMRRRPMQTILGQDWGNVAKSEKKMLYYYSEYYRYKYIEKLASPISHL